MNESLQPFFKNVQSHYDLSDEFFALFLDPSRTYSCAYFSSDDMNLEQAQVAKIDLSLDKCELENGMTLLDVGCGWGATAFKAVQRFNVKAIGLTLSSNQQRFASTQAKERGLEDSARFLLQGWEEFREPVDRIISIGAFEHFRKERHAAFFDSCRSLLPVDGKMLLHTIVNKGLVELTESGIELTEADVLFAKFIRREIFPGGELCDAGRVTLLAEQAGFETTRTQSLRLHYAKTLDCWATELSDCRPEAEQITSHETTERYLKYLRGCAEQFRKGTIDVVQFSLRCKG